MIDWLIDKFWDIVKDSLKDGFKWKPVLVALIVLMGFGCFKYRQQIVTKIRNFYRKLRREDEVQKLKYQLYDIRKRIFTPLEQLGQQDEEFKTKVDNIIGQINSIYSEDKNQQITEESLTQEVRSLEEIYEQSLNEIKRLFESISSALDRAEQMDLTREKRVDDILDRVYPQETEEEKYPSSNRNNIEQSRK
ncbi:hypothetical protein AMR41_11070 [Hapalosiphon sp. MRB220]|nr:hypothetical protein AMR41_11070 [Hapalosiphon sp. MRB220]